MKFHFLYTWMWKMATTSASLFRNLVCRSLFVYSNTTLLELQTLLFLFLSKICASKLGVRLIYGCGLYTDVYGNYERVLTESSAVSWMLFLVVSVQMFSEWSFAWESISIRLVSNYICHRALSRIESPTLPFLSAFTHFFISTQRTLPTKTRHNLLTIPLTIRYLYYLLYNTSLDYNSYTTFTVCFFFFAITHLCT